MPYVAVVFNPNIYLSDNGCQAYAGQSSFEDAIRDKVGTIQMLKSDASAADAAVKLNEIIAKVSTTRLLAATSLSSLSSNSSQSSDSSISSSVSVSSQSSDSSISSSVSASSESSDSSISSISSDSSQSVP